MLAVGFLQVFFYQGKEVPFYNFYLEWVLDFVKCFFMYYWYDPVFLFFSYLVIDSINWFSNVEPALHTWDKSFLAVVYNFFYRLLDMIC